MTDQNPSEQPAWQPPPGPSGWAAPGPSGWAAPDPSNWPAPGTMPYYSPGVYPPGPPSVRTRRMRTALIWSAVVLVASVSTGAVGYEIGLQHSRISSVIQGATALSGPCPAGVTAPDPSATSPAGATLLDRALLVPVGDTPVTAQPEGAVSLRDYVNALYSSDPSSEQQRLVALCFQTAAHRAWTSPGGTITSVWLVQFGTPAGARSYILRTEQADAANPANSDVFQVPRVADGKGLGAPKLDTYGNTLTRVLGDAGNVAIIIHIFVPARTDNSAAASILQQQSSALTSTSS